MRRMTWAAAILLVFSLVLSACGKKDAESVVKDLDKVVSNMESYQGTGTMKLNTGQQELTYNVDVSYQKPHYYRIKLTNAEKDITQIVLRNDDGVFVLTPRLNKVFRFQSDWPQNQGQVYLYQTLIQSILTDNSRQFAVDDKSYVFDVMANYNNGTLARQKIWLNKSDYKPVQVQVSDANASVMVQVDFTSFEFGPSFEKTTFETEANMKSSPSSGGTGDQPTLADPDQDQTDVNGSTNAGSEESKDAVTPDKSAETQDDSKTDGKTDDQATKDDDKNAAAEDEEDADDTTANPEADAASELQVMVPTELPDGVVLKDSMDIVFGGLPGVVSRYTGSYDFSIIQTQPKDMAATYTGGTFLDLGFTIGELSGGDDQKTLTWIVDGNQLRLTSSTLPETEMIRIAQSVQVDTTK
ncbi:outer membrane lipoprotein carrier protein LolA [Paenibacillus glycanilyticus]|uniref:LolA family protein n=1 Tax=Paenibacillus glycanilyticus TaxID=126569 RepID=UPI0020405447|nr:outer membrane lipoprotein carrier protein LolA [Paenibacillus glycanilyticus]MCM3631015.1 outer membrane lipoprotein carrier protein LolA [Paenibacillus glycanilyticus]